MDQDRIIATLNVLMLLTETPAYWNAPQGSLLMTTTFVETAQMCVTSRELIRMEYARDLVIGLG